MAGTELDPLFVKGLRLLHSKSKDSTEQLKQLLDDVIAQSKSAYSKERIFTSVKLEGDKIQLKKSLKDVPEVTSFSSKYISDDNRDRKAEKRPAEKTKQESMEIEAKIPKLEPPQVYPYYPSSPDLPKLDQYDIKKDEDSDSSEENVDPDDFAVEMGLACIICSSLDVTQGNQLIECQECHSLYHQECHKPPATDYDYNDPRRVWYCSKCVKNMKKMATKTQKTAKASVSCAAKESVSQTKTTRSEGSPPATILPFKRTEIKTSISQGNTQTTANKPMGLAGLAANFGGRTGSLSSTSSLPSTSRGPKVTTPTGSLKTPFSTGATLPKPPASKPPPVSAFQSAAPAVTSSQKQPAAAGSVSKGLGLLSAAAAASRSSAAAAAAQQSSGNGSSSSAGHKVPSCSPLMSADKRLQIMKKKASKMQERRRLSNK